MNEKLIYQLLDSLRATSLSQNEAFVLAIQLIVWGKISSEEAISKELRLNADLVSDPDLARATLAKLGLEQGLVGQAFFDTRCADRIETIAIRSILGLLMYLSDVGILRNIEASDVSKLLESRWVGATTSIPEEIAALLVGIARVHTDETVYTPWDFDGQISTISSSNAKEVYLETPWHSAIPALVSLLGQKQFQIQYSDPIRSPSAIDNGKPRQFDVSIAFPPMGSRYEIDVVERDLFGRFPESTVSGAVLTVRHMLSQTHRRVVVAVQNNLLFSTGGEREFREKIISSGMLKAVVSMPSGLLSHTNISFSILVIDPKGDHKNIKFINAEAPFFKESTSRSKCRLVHIKELIEQINDHESSEYTADVTIAEVLKNDAQLQVSRYILPDATKQLHARLNSASTVVLGEVVSTVRPMQTVLGDGECIDAFEIGAPDLPVYGYIPKPGRSVTIDRQVSLKNRDQFLLPLDIVLIVKGSVGKIGIVPMDVPAPGEGGWVAGQSAIVLRSISKGHIDPIALAVQLRSPFGQVLLNSIVSGASIKLIQLRELIRLRVLSPNEEEMKRAVEILDHETQLQVEIEQLRDEQSQVAADMWSMS